MYEDLPSVAHTVDRAGFVVVDDKRVLTQPGEPLRYQSTALITCQRCGRRAVAQSLRVVCEADKRIRGGKRYFHVPARTARGRDICVDCHERNIRAVSP
jgi:hypothetical protein